MTSPHPAGPPVPRQPTFLDRILSGEVMGFLAIAALGMALQVLFFNVPDPVHEVIRIVQITVFAMFGAEYFYGLVRAQNRAAYMAKPERLFDLVVLLLAAVSFLPVFDHRLLNAQALQILRVGPVFFFGYLGTKELSMSLFSEAHEEESSVSASFFRLSEEGANGTLASCTEEEALNWMADPKRRGFYICRGEVTDQLADALADADIPASLLKGALGQSSFPRVLRIGSIYLLAGAIPTISADEENVPAHVHRVTFVAVFTKNSVLLINRAGIAISEEIMRIISSEQILSGHPRPVRVVGGLCKFVLDKYEMYGMEIEALLRQTELAPLDRSGGGVYRSMYFLRRSLSSLKSDLWSFRHILHGIDDGTRPTIFEDVDTKGFFSLLAHSCDFHFENFDQLNDKASAILDLRINLVSFEMNKFMGLLAVVTAIGLIPATFGGLLGMNIEGINFHISLGNIVFLCSVLIAMTLYVMHVNGWLKFR